MARRQTVQDPTGVISAIPVVGVTEAWGRGAPSNAQPGFATGCIYHRINGSTGTSLYLNEGTNTSTTWVTMSGSGATSGTVTLATTFTGGVTLTTLGMTITDVDIALSNTTGTKIGTATTDKLGFYNATPIVQRTSASQAAVVTTPATNSSPYGYSQAQADAIVTLVNELRAALVAVGLIKGS